MAGGYQPPTKPAAVSGPGRFSKRTDSGAPTQPGREMTGGEYGESKDMRDLQGSAPLAASGRLPQSAPPAPVQSAAQQAVTPFGAPTQRPDEPVTAGNPRGPGPGPGQLGTPFTASRLSDALRQIASEDVDGSLDSLIQALESAGQ